MARWERAARAAFYPRLAETDERSLCVRGLCLGHDGCALCIMAEPAVLILPLPEMNTDKIANIDGYNRIFQAPMCRLFSGLQVPASCMISLQKPFGIVQRRFCTMQRLFRATLAKKAKTYADNMIKMGLLLATHLKNQRIRILAKTWLIAACMLLASVPLPSITHATVDVKNRELHQSRHRRECQTPYRTEALIQYISRNGVDRSAPRQGSIDTKAWSKWRRRQRQQRRNTMTSAPQRTTRVYRRTSTWPTIDTVIWRLLTRGRRPKR